MAKAAFQIAESFPNRGRGWCGEIDGQKRNLWHVLHEFVGFDTERGNGGGRDAVEGSIAGLHVYERDSYASARA